MLFTKVGSLPNSQAKAEAETEKYKLPEWAIPGFFAVCAVGTTLAAIFFWSESQPIALICILFTLLSCFGLYMLYEEKQKKTS